MKGAAVDHGYVNVMETGELAYVMLVYVLHGAIVFAQASLACFLLVTGIKLALAPSASRAWGALRVALSMMLLAPVAVGAHASVSLLGATAAFGLLLFSGRQVSEMLTLPMRAMHSLSLACAAVAALFMVWEGEDNLALGADLLLTTIEFRNEEVSWQQANDPQSPKIGDLAPDFELQDPTGKVRVRLSDFRGKRPVALIFGSYT